MNVLRFISMWAVLLFANLAEPSIRATCRSRRRPRKSPALLHAVAATEPWPNYRSTTCRYCADRPVPVLRGLVLRAVLSALLCGRAVADRAHDIVDHADS